MDCIPYIKDLLTEIDVLKQINDGDAEITKKIKEKEALIEKCKKSLEELSNNKIEYRLYLKILNGLKPSKAVEEVANENYLNGIKPTVYLIFLQNIIKKIKKYL